MGVLGASVVSAGEDGSVEVESEGVGVGLSGLFGVSVGVSGRRGSSLRGLSPWQAVQSTTIEQRAIMILFQQFIEWRVLDYSAKLGFIVISITVNGHY